MKKILTLLTITSLVGPTTILNANNFLTPNIKTNYCQTNNLVITTPEEKGQDLIQEKTPLGSRLVLVSAETISKWDKLTNLPTAEMIEKIEYDLKQFKDESEKTIKFYIVAKAIVAKFDTWILTENWHLYGVELFLRENLEDTLLLSVSPQFSPNNSNSSFLEEEFSLLGANKLYIGISRKQWTKIADTKKDELEIFNIINEFPQQPALLHKEINQKTVKLMAQIIVIKFDKLKEFFEQSKEQGTGWTMLSDTSKSFIDFYAQ